MSQKYPNQFPQQPPPFPSFGAPSPKPSSGTNWLWIILGVIGTGAVCTVCCCGGIFYYARTAANSQLAAVAAATEPFSVASIPPPPMPELGAGKPLRDLAGAKLFHVKWGPEQKTIPSKPGVGGEMYVLLPPGNHQPGSLPCLLVAPAGTNLLTGANTGPYFESHIPYLQAGFAIMDYEFDGSPDYETEEGEATRAFIDSQAGLVNSRNVIDFVLQKMPMVNSKQIFAVGHSSGGTHVLLLGEHDRRLAGVVAYAAVSDVPKRLPPSVARMLGNNDKRIGEFLVQSSPLTHVSRMNCPVLLCHAEDDSNVPVSDSREMHKQLIAAGKRSDLFITPTGDHYDEMLERCVPKGIQWMKKQMDDAK
ncbi:MAG: prolyl oligopeptidase family serine peptidase [Pirellulaceae bacterium]|nr:prolyl oligopeptidase family serine peptidase [Pirellulaceae bacterium]